MIMLKVLYITSLLVSEKYYLDMEKFKFTNIKFYMIFNIHYILGFVPETRILRYCQNEAYSFAMHLPELFP